MLARLNSADGRNGNRYRRWVGGMALLGALLVAESWPASAMRAQDASKASSCCSSWVRVRAEGITDGVLNDVSGVSADDAWAVGRSGNPGYVQAVTLIEHWDGRHWSIVPSPNRGGDGGRPPNSELHGVVAITHRDAWAVGDLLAHWDGSAWDSAPMPPGDTMTLYDVAAAGPSDVWAVGLQAGVVGQGVILHWDGRSWKVIPSPRFSRDAGLRGVSVVSGRDVWAVGGRDVDSRDHPLVEHWDGTAWTVVRAQTPSTHDGSFEAVSFDAPDDGWAVGHRDGFDTLVEHWNGTNWTIVRSPEDHHYTQLAGVAAASPGDVWAVGFGGNSSGFGDALIEHWDGTAWRVVSSRGAGGGRHLTSAALDPSGRVWAVGAFGSWTSYPPQAVLVMRVRPVAVGDAGFRHRSYRTRRRAPTFFRVDPAATISHGFTDASGLGLFTSGLLSPGSSFDYRFMASGTFRVEDPASGATTRVRIAPTVTPRAGPSSETFHVRWAAVAAASPFVYDVEVRTPTGPEFVPWRHGVVASSGSYTPTAGAGTYEFRARVRIPKTARSSWSPVAVLRVH
jgi:hypothetical protein